MSDPFLLLILSSPSGAGKTTLTRKLREKFPNLRFSVSHTTRKPRATEENGRDYHFINRKDFDELVEREAFLEWAHVHENCYGTSLGEIERAKADPQCAGIIFDIDYQGARQIRAKVPEAIAVFILPPSMIELERRLKGRNSETEEMVRKRFAAAQVEIEHYGFFDYLVVNDEIDKAFGDLEGIILAERSRRHRRAELAERLLRAGKL
ncbi:MAG: guanylate kinase [Labilithrix sp.]|nr:guanylate kinase [Labilithrix sp.]MCW5814101.1 guanylate kinase [Labilithrix sp.]